MALRLYWNNEQEKMAIGDTLIARLEQLLQLAGEHEDVTDGVVALSFVDDAAIRELNRQYRSIDRATDVLSFAMQEDGEGEPDIDYGDLEEAEDADWEGEADQEDDAEEEDGEPLGDIVISVERAIAQSEEYGHSAERELGFLFVHGFLHLIGYDHGTAEEEKEMFSRQELILHQAGLTR
ncbi:rRNA maturation RNase YbeY [Paenibacillus cymbidii]|uniref:rRNA maturation RNase YbeY n=1 Tax=Paenibacillus cymbidii TaxID=1639034 RepID=UPI0010803CD8|nr:rRNA maturation RNase YbeY [Paenibacillus cymbidii]